MVAVAPFWTKIPVLSVPHVEGPGPVTVKPLKVAVVVEPVIVTMFSDPKLSVAIVAGACIVGADFGADWTVSDMPIVTCSTKVPEHTLTVSPALAAAMAADIVLKPGALHDPPLVPVPVGLGATHHFAPVAKTVTGAAI